MTQSTDPDEGVPPTGSWTPTPPTPPTGGWPQPDPWAQPPMTQETGADAGGPPPAWWGTPPPAAPLPPVPRAPEPKRSALMVAIVIIAILSGSALFVSGFTLGLQQALAPGTPSGERDLFDPFWEAYRKITTEYVGVGKITPKDLVEGAIGGMFKAVGDPYSSYMTSKEYQDSLGGISGEFEGIGAQMTSQSPTGDQCDTLGPTCALVVVDVIRDSPAEKAGLLPNDQLVAVDGTKVDGQTLDDVVGRVKGPRDTAVTLTLLRDGKTLDLKIVRGVVRTEDVHSETLADGTVGYLDVTGFSGSAAQDFHDLLKGQLDQGIKKFVIDLRDDPGGFVDAAQSIASQFIASGPVYWEEYADGTQVPTAASGDGLATDPAIQVAVLINGGSASASEILAGALQDTGRGSLIGEQSFGKGTIQQWHLLANDTGGFRLSVAKWLTPDKRWIHGVGLTPDIPVSPGTTGTGTDPQLDRALELLRSGPIMSPSPGATADAGGSDASAGAVASPSASAGPVPPSSPQTMGWPLRLSVIGSLRSIG